MDGRCGDCPKGSPSEPAASEQGECLAHHDLPYPEDVLGYVVSLLHKVRIAGEI